MSQDNMQEGIERLRQILTRLRAGGYPDDPIPSINARSEVERRFQPILGKANLDKLTEEDFRSFLPIRNNRHWTGLARQGPRICRDMPALRQALSVLQDESLPIALRYDYATSKVNGLGKAITTAILVVLFPSQYGVWNNISQSGLQLLGLWPARRRGESEGSHYARINQTLLTLSQGLDIDLWSLDSLWHYLVKVEEADSSSAS